MRPETSLEKATDSQPLVRETGIAAFAIKNPHFIVMACFVTVLMGGLALTLLPKDLLPASNLPAVQILSFYPGMPVDHVEKNLTSPYELYTGQAIGMERQESKSIVGVSVVKNFFGPGTDLNTALAQTTALTMSVLRRLPPGTQPPLILPFDPMASVPLALVAVGGDKAQKDLYDTARYDVRNAVQAVSGAMAPTVMGGSERQVVVYTDSKRLHAYNFSPLSVMERLALLNTFIPTGSVKIGNFDYQILSNGMVDRVEDMNDFPLRSGNGTAIYLRDVAEAKDSSKVQTNMVTVDRKPQVYVPIYRQPGANSLQIVDAVKGSLKALEQKLGGVSLRLIADQSVFIRHAIESISEEAIIGGGLAALMVFLFLGNPRATVGIFISLPLSLLCAFLGLKAMGETLNAMTLGGLALSIGVLVDNSIVVLENVSKKLNQGLPPRRAALEGAGEVAKPVLAATLATMIVFFPVLFLSGVVKLLFSALAKAVIFAMIGSFLAAMAVVPLFAARFLKPETGKKAKLFLVMEHLVARLTHFYGRRLNWAMGHQKTVLAMAVGILLLGAGLARGLGTELFPRADAGNFIVALRLATGTRIEETQRFSKILEERLREIIPGEDLAMIVGNAGVYYGFPAAFTPNTGPQDVFFNVELTEHRKHTSQYYARLLRDRIPKEFPTVEMGIELGGLLSSALNGGLRAPIDIQIEGPKPEVAHELAETLKAKILPLRGAVDVRIQQRLDAPQLFLNVNRRKAATLGLTTDEVVKNIVSAVSGSATFSPTIWVDPRNGIDYLMGVQYPESAIKSVRELAEIPITGRRQERSVALGDIATIAQAKGPSEINHVNLKSVVDIFLDAQDRDIGGLSREIDSVVKQTALPPGYSVETRGEVREMNRAIGSLGGGFLLAAILVYVILVIQFRSYLLPLIMMVSVPLGLVGVVAMLWVTGTYFSIQAAIGAIFMIGIAVANGVLLLEFILHEAESPARKDIEEAIFHGATARLRPILMTSLASMLGLVPMAIGLGKGAEANIPLGRAVIGGQLLSTVLTLFVVPVLFRMFYRPASGKKQALFPVAPPSRPYLGLLLLLVGSALCSETAPAQQPPLQFSEFMERVEKTDPSLLAASARRAQAVESVEVARAGYYPKIDFMAIESAGFPASSGLTGVGGLMGSAYRSGPAYGLVATVPLLDFGRTSHGVDSAKFSVAAREEEQKIRRTEVYLVALKVYLDCTRFRSQHEVWKGFADEAAQIEKEVVRFVKTGQRSQVDHYLAQTQTEEAVTASAEYAERYASTLDYLALLSGSGKAELHCSPIHDVPEGVFGGLKTEDVNPLIARAQAELAASTARVNLASSGHYPRLVGVASVGDMEKSRLVPEQHYSAGVGLIIPLFEGFRVTSEVSRAKSEVVEKDSEVRGAVRRVTELNIKYDETINASRVRLTHLAQELELGRQAYRLAKKRYLALEGTLVDVREGLRNLQRVETQSNEVKAEFLFATGARKILNGGHF